ncbi:hypothetical protein QQS21_007642 [Conoideocrella luteorostrata]|uniref:Heat-labile enterotoxin alpha chain n=1 Tax=Conoideocrella luteorostrata TaxID=1105319 RepID=A0AAJ0CPQ3_9HYPO|nr:hypothetical protein QQS21_007642 [Conoideocrella luteorostrata]
MTTKPSLWVIWVTLTLAIFLLAWPSSALNPPKGTVQQAETAKTRPLRLNIPEGKLPSISEDESLSVQKRQQSSPKVVYRGSSKSPETIKELGGFIPRDEGQTITNNTFGLLNHHWGLSRTAYSSTSRSFGVALGYSMKEHESGWIYKIHPTPNMIDLNGSGFKLQYHEEEEFSALGGIRYDQIQAWMRMSSEILMHSLSMDDVRKFREFETFAKAYPNSTWTNNTAYDHKYDTFASSPGQPQLAGNKDNVAKFGNKTLEQHAIEFMKKNGGPVAWNGQFPLSSLKTKNEEAPQMTEDHATHTTTSSRQTIETTVLAEYNIEAIEPKI